MSSRQASKRERLEDQPKKSMKQNDISYSDLVDKATRAFQEMATMVDASKDRVHGRIQNQTGFS